MNAINIKDNIINIMNAAAILYKYQDWEKAESLDLFCFPQLQFCNEL